MCKGACAGLLASLGVATDTSTVIVMGNFMYSVGGVKEKYFAREKADVFVSLSFRACMSAVVSVGESLALSLGA